MIYNNYSNRLGGAPGRTHPYYFYYTTAKTIVLPSRESFETRISLVITSKQYGGLHGSELLIDLNYHLIEPL